MASVMFAIVFAGIGAMLFLFGVDPDVGEGDDAGITRTAWRVVGAAVAAVGIVILVAGLA